MRIGIDGDPITVGRTGVGLYVAELVSHILRLAPQEEFLIYRTRHGSDRACLGAWKGKARVISAPKPLLALRTWLDQLDVYHGTNYRLRGSARQGAVLSIHDLAIVRMPEVARHQWMVGWKCEKTRRMAQRATIVITGSEHTARDLVELIGVPREKIEVTHYGVGEEFYPDRTRAGRKEVCRRHVLPRHRYILFVGTLEPRKNLPTLVAAFGRLPDIRRSHCLVLAGAPGWRVQEIHDAIVRSGLVGEVIMPGYLCADELRSLYTYADLFVYPSLYEGFGFPPLEAMACGAPVITSNVSSLPEVVGDAALQVDPRDPRALAHAMQTVLEDEQVAATLRSRGFDRAKQFSWEQTARKTLQIYRRVSNV